MKKIKLFALTALFCAMGTNAFAAAENGKSATKLFTFDWTVDGTAKTAVITGFVSELDDEFKTAVAIPDSVTDATDAKKKYAVTGIGENAFSGQPIKTITFTAPVKDGYTGVAEIKPGAFAGTNITELNLANTVIKKVENLFGTVIKVDEKGKPTKEDIVNTKLAKVTLPASVTEIAENAFANCTALATIDLTKATELATINAGAFAGCPLKALDLSKNTKVTSLAEKTLLDGSKFKVSTVETVTLHKAFTKLNGNLTADVNLTAVNGLGDKDDKFEIAENEFNGCTALTTINTKYVKAFGKKAFLNCSALTAIDLTSATSLAESTFEATGLTTVTFPAENLTSIPTNCFFQCADLKEVIFTAKDKKTAVDTISTLAFGYTAIESITIPEASEKLVLEAKAFANCTSLKDFTFASTADYDSLNYKFDDAAFFRCSDVKFHTTANFAEKYAEKTSKELPNGPTNVTFDYNTDNSVAFDVKPIEGKSGKYYVKWYAADAAIKVKASEAKVYAAYLEGDNTLNMIRYKADADGYSVIAKADAAIIITENAELKYEAAATTDKSTSWMGTASAEYTDPETLSAGQNALKYVTAETTLSALQLACTDDSYEVYGFMKTGGFQKITTGNKIPKGTVFVFAKEPAAGGRLNVVWRDENGNIEEQTTAIETVKTVTEDGAAYNAAGQQVRAGYKGLVIKNGKKFIVK